MAKLSFDRSRYLFAVAVFGFGVYQGAHLLYQRKTGEAADVHAPGARDLLEDPLPQPTTGLDEKEMSWTLLICIGIEIAAFTIGYILKKTHFKYLQEAGATILLGTLLGLITRLIPTETAQKFRTALTFDEEIFFLFLLPPIIFESGYSMKRKNFFQNLGGICAYAFGGTLIATVSTGGMLYFVVQMGWMKSQLNFLECLLWGSLISATDPVTVLAIFKELKVDLDLYSNVFGESVLNDAVAIVLYRTIAGFVTAPEITAGAFFFAFVQFSVIFVGSTLIGVFVAFVSALYFKYTEFYHHPYLETCVLILFGYTSYLLAEGVYLSGIVSVLFCGIVMAHYTYNNLSEISKELSGNLIAVIAMLTETLVFVFLGVSLFSFDASVDIMFIVCGIVIIQISRALNVYPLSFLVNLARPRKRWIPQRYQFFMWFAGLRGAIAFVLSLDVPSQYGQAMETTTIAIVYFTVLVEGGLTVPLLEYLKIPMGVTQQPEVGEDAYGKANVKLQSSFFRWDAVWLKPFFTRAQAPAAAYHEAPKEDIESIEMSRMDESGEQDSNNNTELGESDRDEERKHLTL